MESLHLLSFSDKTNKLFEQLVKLVIIYVFILIGLREYHRERLLRVFVSGDAQQVRLVPAPRLDVKS